MTPFAIFKNYLKSDFAKLLNNIPALLKLENLKPISSALEAYAYDVGPNFFLSSSSKYIESLSHTQSNMHATFILNNTHVYCVL